MFDLFRSQRKTVKIVLTVILSLVGLSMVITLIPGMFSTPVADLNDPVLVEVGDSTVTVRDVQMRLRDYAQGGVPPESMAFLARQIVDTVTEDKMMLEEAERMGVKPDERELARWLAEQMPFLFQNGEFVGEMQYARMIQQRFQQSIPEFEQNVLRDLAVNVRLRNLVTDNIVVTPEDLRREYRRRNETAKIRYVSFQAADFRDQVEPTEEELQTYFENNKLRYRLQERRSATILSLEDGTPPEIEVSDDEIRNYYEQNRYRFETDERVRASHILFMTMDKSEAETADVEKKAQEVLAKVKAGQDFAELAKEYSEDPGTKDKGGDLGFVTRGQMTPSFETATFALEPGQTSELVKTEYGYHIIKVVDKEPGGMLPLEEVRDQIVEDLRAERQAMAAQQRNDEVMTKALEAGPNLEAVGEELSLPVETYESFSRVEAPEELSSQPTLFGTLFSMPLNDPTTVAQGDKSYIAVVTEIEPSRDATLEEVRDRVEEDYIAAQARDLAQQKAREVAEKAREQGSLEEAAREMKLDVAVSEPFTRQGAVEGFAPAGVLGETPFQADIGAVNGPVVSGDTAGVYEVSERLEADMAQFPGQSEELRSETLQARRDEAFDIFQADVRRRYQEDGRIVRYEDRIAELLRQLGRAS